MTLKKEILDTTFFSKIDSYIEQFKGHVTGVFVSNNIFELMKSLLVTTDLLPSQSFWYDQFTFHYYSQKHGSLLIRCDIKLEPNKVAIAGTPEVVYEYHNVV